MTVEKKMCQPCSKYNAKQVTAKYMGLYRDGTEQYICCNCLMLDHDSIRSNTTLEYDGWIDKSGKFVADTMSPVFRYGEDGSCEMIIKE